MVHYLSEPLPRGKDVHYAWLVGWGLSFTYMPCVCAEERRLKNYALSPRCKIFKSIMVLGAWETSLRESNWPLRQHWLLHACTAMERLKGKSPDQCRGQVWCAVLLKTCSTWSRSSFWMLEWSLLSNQKRQKALPLNAHAWAFQIHEETKRSPELQDTSTGPEYKHPPKTTMLQLMYFFRDAKNPCNLLGSTSITCSPLPSWSHPETSHHCLAAGPGKNKELLTTLQRQFVVLSSLNVETLFSGNCKISIYTGCDP